MSLQRHSHHVRSARSQANQRKVSCHGSRRIGTHAYAVRRHMYIMYKQMDVLPERVAEPCLYYQKKLRRSLYNLLVFSFSFRCTSSTLFLLNLGDPPRPCCSSNSFLSEYHFNVICMLKFPSFNSEWQSTNKVEMIKVRHLKRK